MPSPMEVLTLMADLSPEKMSEMWQQVKENQARLERCAKHRFEQPINFGHKLVCLNCGGEMSGTSVRDYSRGYAAGGGDPKEIWTHYR